MNIGQYFREAEKAAAKAAELLGQGGDQASAARLGCGGPAEARQLSRRDFGPPGVRAGFLS